MLLTVPLALNEGSRGRALAFQVTLGPMVAAVLLVAFVALVQAGGVRGSRRTLAMFAVTTVAAAIASMIDVLLLMALSVFTASRASVPVIWWGNFGFIAMICLAAAFIEDYRTRSNERAAALRDARLRAADIVRRTAEVRLQAARARVEPRFLFDALSAVERAYDADAAAGHRLLDDLVTYLRAVTPDLRETQRDDARESEIARLRLAIERAIGEDPCSIAEVDDEEPESDHR